MVRRITLTLVALVSLAGCGGPDVDPGQQLKDAAAALKSLSSLQLDLKFGPGATISAGVLTVNLLSGTGKVRFPADSDLVGRVQQGDNILEAEIVSLGGDVYFKPSAIFPARKLSAEEAQQYPTAARLLDRDTGLATVLAKGKNAKFSGMETIDGQDCYKIEADYPAADLKQAVAPFTPADQTHALVWIGKGDHLVRKARLTGHLFNPNNDSFIEVHLRDFNAAVDIVKP